MIKSSPKSSSYQPLNDEKLLSLAEDVMASSSDNHDYLTDMYKAGRLSLSDLNEIIRAKTRFKQILRKSLPGNHMEDVNVDLKTSHDLALKLGWTPKENAKHMKWVGPSGRVIDRIKLKDQTLSVRQLVTSLHDTKSHLRAHHFKNLAADESVNLVRAMVFQIGASIQDELIFKRQGDRFLYDPHLSHIKSEMENAVFAPLKKLAGEMGFMGIEGVSPTAPYFEHVKFPGGLFSVTLGHSRESSKSKKVLRIDELLGTVCPRDELSRLVRGGALRKLGLFTLEYKSADAVTTRYDWRQYKSILAGRNLRGPHSPKRIAHMSALRGNK